jgi:hypothetical protein
VKKPDYYTRCGRGKRPKFAVWDLETDGLGGPVIAGSYMKEGDDDATYITGTERHIIQSIFDHMCVYSEYTWFAHNAQYEFRYLIDHFLDHRDRLHFFLRTDSDVFMVIIDIPDYGEGKKLVLRDSFAIWDLPLKRRKPTDPKGIADTFCPELLKASVDFDTEVFNPSDPEHIAYSKQDSLVLLTSLVRFNDLLLEQFDCHMQSTRAATALVAWQRTLKSDERYYNHKEDEEYVRSAYYGGLVFLTSTLRHKGAHTYDINSSYPYQMLSHPLPVGKSVRTKLFAARYLGIYNVTVKAPDDLVVPILPKRDARGIIWPRGVFETTVTSVELDFAARHGYAILKINDGRVWYDTCSPFTDFIAKCVGIRMQNPSGSTLDWTAKYMQNSLYGKFGAKRKRRKIHAFIPDDYDGPVDMWGDFFVTTDYAEDLLCNPVWSVFITAYARIHLLTAIYAVGPANVLYGDTDSITVKSGIELGTGKEYGKWKLEKNWQEFRAHGPKVYAGVLESGKMTGAAKGIPRRTWDKSGIFQSILNAENNAIVRYRTLEKFVIALKTRYNGEHDAQRSLSSLGNSRSWREEPNGDVRPRYWHEIQALQNQGKEDIRKRNRAA